MIDLDELKRYEKEAINKTILMMAYNPSCARIFSHEANIEIKERISEIVDLLPSIDTEEDFNREHKRVMDSIVSDVKNIRKNNPNGEISYGQAQKGLNVFLKVYVDWANLPSVEVSNKLRHCLHCPLDSVVMNTIKREEKGLYKKHGNPPCKIRDIKNYEQYFSWQRLIREIVSRNDASQKPLLIDIIWYIDSLKKKK